MLPVDIAIQDYFFSAVQGSTSGATPISNERWEAWFQTWLDHLRPDFPTSQGYELSLRLTTDEDIQSLNAQYRQQDRPTDVLAFAALEGDYPIPEDMADALPLYLGDIVISVETAQAQAQERGHALQDELAWLAAHGLLHLLGWDHPDEESLVAMLHQQTSLLRLVGFNLHYDEA